MATSAWLHGPSAMRLTEGLVSVLKEQRPEYVPALLANYREHGVFSTQGPGAVGGLVGFSNAKLGSTKTRFEGLCLLSMLVKDSSCELFQQHCLSWLRSLQQVIQSQAPVQTIQLAVTILKDLLQYSTQLAELAREVGLNSILGILTSLLGLKTECELAAMEGMTACMTYYPRACGSLRDKLGAYFLSKMDSTNKKTQEMACQCYGRLPCLGGLLDRGVGAGRAEGWTNQIHCLLASANNILAQIYQGAETDGTVQYEGPGVELAFPHLDQTDPLLLMQLQQRYAAVCLALRHTLRVDPASAVRVPVRPILNLVCRALAVSSKSINLTGDGSVRLLFLPVIHTNTLEILSGLITVVRSSMVQYAAVLQRLFSQTLSAWTPQNEASPGQQRAYSLVRVSVYRTIELWVQVAGASASILQGSPSHSEMLFSHLLGDITPGTESVKLRAGLSADAVPGGKPGPRRTKPLVMSDAVGPSLQRKGDIMANQDTCLSALRALRQIILASGTLLKDDIHKRLHDVVLPLCVRLQQQQSSSSTMCESVGGISGQYSSALTRRELYRLLLALVLVPSPRWPPPLTCAVSILSNGRTDRNLKVSSFCIEALTISNTLLHPRTPSIAMPLPPLALKPTPSAPGLSSQGPNPGLTLPTLLGGPAPAPGPPFPSRHSLGLGPASLLGSLENHLSLVPGLPGQGHAPSDMILSPHGHHQPDPAGLGPPEGQRPVFVRYDKEEADDVEISLASDSDDSVVIVPPGMLNMDNQPDEAAAAAANSQNLASVVPGGSTVSLPGSDSVTMVPPTPATTTIDGVSLPNDLATSSPLLTTSTTPINSFPPSSSSVVSLVPLLNSSTLTATPGGLGDSLPGRPQLQQMLMQPSAPGPMPLPLQMHQLQLNQQARHLHQLQPPPPPPSNEDSAVININSTDDEEEEEEDMEDDEELEEDEEGMDEEDEEEEVSDFAEGEFYDGEEYEDYDEEEGEELEEEEEEEDGHIPPLEGAEDKEAEAGVEEGKVLRAAVDEGGMAGFSVEGEAEGGIEEIQTSRAMLGEDRMKVQEVESIGVLEEAREAEAEGEEESERMDDPTMPQILCVTGGAMDEREEAEEEEEEEEDGEEGECRRGEEGGVLQEEAGSWQQAANEDEAAAAALDEHTASQSQQETGAAPLQEVTGVSDSQPPIILQEERLAAMQLAAVATPPAEPETPVAPSAKEHEEADTEKKDMADAGERGAEGEAADTEGEEGKGLKRKREESHMEEETGQSPEKKKLDEEAMASMLADFVACPPDDEDGASGSNCS